MSSLNPLTIREEKNYGLVYLCKRIACDRNKLSEKKEKRTSVKYHPPSRLLSMLVLEVR
jgi:hypothetical protein